LDSKGMLMRTRKKRGSKPAAVTFTHKDIMALCFKQAKELGLPVANRAVISYPVLAEGKVTGRNVEVQIDLTENVEGK